MYLHENMDMGDFENHSNVNAGEIPSPEEVLAERCRTFANELSSGTLRVPTSMGVKALIEDSTLEEIDPEVTPLLTVQRYRFDATQIDDDPSLAEYEFSTKTTADILTGILPTAMASQLAAKHPDDWKMAVAASANSEAVLRRIMSERYVANEEGEVVLADFCLKIVLDRDSLLKVTYAYEPSGDNDEDAVSTHDKQAFALLTGDAFSPDEYARRAISLLDVVHGGLTRQKLV